MPVEKSAAMPRTAPSPARGPHRDFRWSKAGMGVRKAVQRARELRRNPTDTERKLWHHIRDKQMENFRFRRQRPIGKYIVDFICLEANLVIELDGGQHADQQQYDAERTKYLTSQGLHVLRYWNNDVMQNIEGVLEDIRAALMLRVSLSTPSQPSPQEGKELIVPMEEVSPSTPSPARGKAGSLIGVSRSMLLANQTVCAYQRIRYLQDGARNTSPPPNKNQNGKPK
jgi:very-short-patch-repair endonuclease